MSLANRLKQRRLELKLTQASLALKAGISQQAINRIESGLIMRPRYLPELAEVLQCDPLWLVHGKTDQNKA